MTNPAFRTSLGIRHLVCGSCNGCEHEMNALSNAYYDITRDGWSLVASPRHADVVTVTGPMTAAMRSAAAETVEAVPAPRVIVAIGDCAAGAGPWAEAPAAGEGAGVDLGAAIFVYGCPPTPDAIRAGLEAAGDVLSRGDEPARSVQIGTPAWPAAAADPEATSSI
jgi:Ni,Fe-hydrogenase III small subunit